MKRGIAILLLGVAAVAAAQSQKNGPAQGAKTTTQALINLENEWVDALAKADTASLDSIFAETYVDTDEHSHRSDKRGVLSVLKSGDLKIRSIKLSGMKVYDYGDAAVVTGSASQAGSFKGQPFAMSIIFTDTFIREDKKWRAVASHRSTTQ